VDDGRVRIDVEEDGRGDGGLCALLDPARLARLPRDGVEQGVEERAARRDAIAGRRGEAGERVGELLAGHDALEADLSGHHTPPSAPRLLDQLVALEPAAYVSDDPLRNGVKAELARDQMEEAAAPDQMRDRVCAAARRPTDEDGVACFAYRNHGREP
jgi:hypothetical protein